MQEALTDATVEDPSGPDAALAALYTERFAPMVRLAHLVTGNNAVAQDVVHDAFLKVAPRLAGVDNANAYLRQAVINECRQWFRRSEVEARYERIDRASREHLTLPPEHDDMWNALAKLPEGRRVTLVLRFYEDLSIKQIAEVLGCREGTVKAQIHRGLKSLKEMTTDGR